jgi:hypothetical protein
MDDEDAKLEVAAYKIMADSAERTADRRQEANNFFITLSTAIAAFDAFVLQQGYDTNLLFLGGLVGALGSVLWGFTLWYYRSLSSAKFQLLGEFEVEKGIVGYQREWEIFSARSWFGKAHVSLSTIEFGVAVIAFVAHFSVVIIFHDVKKHEEKPADPPAAAAPASPAPAEKAPK